MARKQTSSFSSTDLFLIILALLLVGTSFWQTWLGLDQIFGKASFIIALVLALLLLFFSWAIRVAKKNGRPTTGLVWTYVFIASFCFIANFNAIYTRFMKKEIYIEEMTRVRDEFPTLSNSVDGQLSYSVADPKTRREILELTNQLKLQIRDPKNQGIGTEARKIIDKIEKTLGKTLTPLTPTSQTPEGYEDLANRMEAQIMSLVETLSPNERDLRANISKVSAQETKRLSEAIDNIDDVIAQEQAFPTVNHSIAEYNKLGSAAQMVLNGRYQHESLKTDIGQVGKISYTFRHAFEEFGITTLLVLAGCLLLDFVLVIIVLQTSSANDTPTAPRGTNRRSGQTII